MTSSSTQLSHHDDIIDLGSDIWPQDAQVLIQLSTSQWISEGVVQVGLEDNLLILLQWALPAVLRFPGRTREAGMLRNRPCNQHQPHITSSPHHIIHPVPTSSRLVHPVFQSSEHSGMFLATRLNFSVYPQ